MDDHDQPEPMVNRKTQKPHMMSPMSGSREICQPADGDTIPCATKSSAQVESFVSQQAVRQSSGGLKPDISRSYRLVIRFSKKERESIVRHAEEARMTISEYGRLTLLKSPGLDPQRNKYLMRANYQLSRHGTNLNQIAKHLNMGGVNPSDAERDLLAMREDFSNAYRAVSAALSNGKKYEDAD